MQGPGLLTFSMRSSSESCPAEGPDCGDFIKFVVDDVVLQTSNGDSGWIPHSYDLPVGSHTVRFEYVKDFQTIQFDDTAYIKDVVLACPSIADCATCADDICSRCQRDLALISPTLCGTCGSGTYVKDVTLPCEACPGLPRCLALVCTNATDQTCSSCVQPAAI